MKILSTEAIQSVDRAAIEVLGVPGIVLMENAALGVVDAVIELVPEATTAAIFCGPGNNGGDGLAVARHLAVRGFRIQAVLATGGREYAGDARVQLEIARNLSDFGVEVQELGSSDSLDAVTRQAASADVVIDALFGTGLSRPLEGGFAELVEAINALPGPRVAIDLPSGLSGDRFDLPGPHVLADVTVTFAAPQIAHIFPPAAEAVGLLAIADLGVPEDFVERAEGDLYLLEREDLASVLGHRERSSHKGDYGHLLLVGGSAGKSGAAILSAQAAIRAGAGLVTGAVPEAIFDVFEASSLESMSVALPPDPDGGLGEAALDALRAAAGSKSALALGPGLGTEASTQETVRQIVLESELPAVLDADGLNAFAGDLERLADRSPPTVLTPHPGELGRLLGVDTAAVVADRLAAVREAARRSHCVVVLKGHLSLIAETGAGVYVNPTGNAGMATGGSGDVLTGMIGALMAGGLDALVAAQVGVFVHGLAGDLAADRTGEISLAAADVLGSVPAAFGRLSGRAVTAETEGSPPFPEGGKPPQAGAAE